MTNQDAQSLQRCIYGVEWVPAGCQGDWPTGVILSCIAPAQPQQTNDVKRLLNLFWRASAHMFGACQLEWKMGGFGI